MMRGKTFIMMVGLAFIFIITSGASHGTTVMKLAHVAPPGPYKSDEGAMSNVLKNMVEVETGGEIEVKIYPAAQLGGMREMVESTQIGATQAVICYTSVASIFSPKIALIGIPFIFPTADHAWATLDGWFGKDLAEAVRKEAGLRVLAWGEGDGFRVVWNSKRPIHSPADLKGLKIRVPENKGLMGMFKAFGASPVTITWTELYSALQTGVADGSEPELGSGLNIKLYEVSKYITLSNHSYNTHALFVNDAWFRKLPEKHKRALIHAARHAITANRGISQIRVYDSIAFFKEKGLQIYAPKPEEMAQFKKIGQPAYIDFVKELAGAEWVDKALRAAEETRKKLASEEDQLIR